MKSIKRIMLFSLLSLTVYHLQASDKSSQNSDTYDDTSFESDESNDTSIGYFIEKLNADGQTEYFDDPVVFKAKINMPQRTLPWVKKQEATLTITDPKTHQEYIVPMKDFIQCDGPMRALTQKEYRRLLKQ